MSNMKFRKHMLATSVAVALAGGASAPAFAAGQEKAAKEGEIEKIEVRGIRGSLKANVNAKRFSASIVDVINAEDIGKFPDKNVAESLSRVPGVTVQRQFGEGSSVSIRGAGANFTKTTLNGQNVASTGWFVLEPAKRSFNYELLPSEIVGGLEVYKSAQADLSEGGIGGTVVVNTREPLDLDSGTVFGSIEAQYSDDSGKTDPQFSGLYSWKNQEENFGFIVSAVAQRRHLQRQGNEAFWEWGAGPVGFEQDRQRSALSATLQFAPTDNLVFTLNAIDMKMEADNTNYALWLTQADHSWNGDGLVPDEFLGATEGNRGTAVKGKLATAYYQARPREATMNSDVVDLKVEYEGDNYKLSVQVGETTSTGGTDFEMVVDDGVNTPITGGTYDFTNGKQTWNLPNGIGPDGQSMAEYDPGSLVMGTGAAFNATPKTDEESYVQADFEYQLDGDFISSIKTGFRVGDHNTTSRQFFFDQAAGFDNRISTNGLRTGSYDVGHGNYEISRFDVDAIKDWAKASITGKTEDLGSYREIDETNTAVYVMAKYDAQNYRGNFGLRYVQTDATSTYYVDGKLTGTDADYSEVLPSFNLSYDLGEDLILRVAAARAMARPQYNDMYVNPSPTGTNDDTPNNQYWIIGNVGLKPFMADQIDVGVEWYFNPSSLIAASIFHKKVKNFVSITEYHEDAANIDFAIKPEEAEFGWTVQEKNNAKDGDITGLELQYQQDFDNGFGTLINYTYTDTETDADTFEADQNPFLSDSSKNSFNVTGFYENEIFSARVSYNYRSEYMLREEGAYGNRLHDGFGSLDFSGVYHFNDNIDFKLDIVNITGSDSEQFGNNQGQSNASGFADGFPLYAYEMATRVNLGVAFRF